MMHTCQIEVTFPTNLQARQAMQVLQVDAEPSGDRVTKSFRLVMTEEEEQSGGDAGADAAVSKLQVRFQSLELKMLRVSVSSFYDYLSVVLKTMREFDDSIR